MAATTPLSQTPSYLTNYVNNTAKVDPAAVSQRVNTAIQNSQIPNQTEVVKSANEKVQRLPWDVKPLGQAAVSSFQAQIEAAQKQAANQAEALRTKGEATAAYAGNLAALGQGAAGGGGGKLRAGGEKCVARR